MLGGLKFNVSTLVNSLLASYDLSIFVFIAIATSGYINLLK